MIQPYIVFNISNIYLESQYVSDHLRLNKIQSQLRTIIK